MNRTEQMQAWEEDKKRLVKILRSHGIYMDIGGCSCCESPWIKAIYENEIIIDCEGIQINMTKEVL